MSDVREFAHRLARKLTAKSVETGKIADGNPDAVERVDLRGRAYAFSEAALIVLQEIPEGVSVDEEYDDETFEGEEDGISLDGFSNDEEREKWLDDHRSRLEDFK